MWQLTGHICELLVPRFWKAEVACANTEWSLYLETDHFPQAHGDLGAMIKVDKTGDNKLSKAFSH